MIAVLRLPEAIHLMQIFASVFLAILFLQSGIDKIVEVAFADAVVQGD